MHAYVSFVDLSDKMCCQKEWEGAVDWSHWTGVGEGLEGAAVEWVIREIASGRDVVFVSMKEEI